MTAPADDTPALPPGRANLRRVQVGVYVAFAVGILVYAQQEAQQMAGRLTMLTYLLAFYMGARAVAIWVKFRQETARSRYTRAYVEAQDIPLGGDGANDDGDASGSPSHGDGPAATSSTPDSTKDTNGHG
jgi:hypothetical protein